MREQAEALGFKYSRMGCPCSGGTNAIYTLRRGDTTYTLTIWPKRLVWRLTAKNFVVATGNDTNMNDKIKAVWDL